MTLLPLMLCALWELPQNIVGSLLWIFVTLTHMKRETEICGNRIFVESDIMVSLGSFIFCLGRKGNRVREDSDVNRRHEYGHALQSRLLGPLYLPVIGLPSVARLAFLSIYRRTTGRRWANYYGGYPEKWADRLGGVHRACL